jgi:putative NADH-flavin reductase
MPSKKNLTVAVVGPAGMTGSYTVVELLNRGHSVIGISRTPTAIGKHDRYKPVSIDFDNSSISQIANSLEGADVVVKYRPKTAETDGSAYGPHTGGADALQYMPFVETTRKLCLAVRRAKVPYFIMVGGCGSLYLPGQEDDTACDSRQWWLQYRRGIADSEAHVQYMEERLGHLGSSLRGFRNARLAKAAGKGTEEDDKTIAEYEHNILNGDYSTTFVKSCRTTYMFFDGNQSFRWSFLSPSALFRPGSTSIYGK